MALLAIAFWAAAELFAEVAGPKPADGYTTPVASIYREYDSPRLHQRTVHALEDLVTQNGFFLSGGFAPPQVIDGWELYDQRFTHRDHGTEILISTTRKKNALDVFIFDRLHKDKWPEIREKIEATLQGIP